MSLGEIDILLLFLLVFDGRFGLCSSSRRETVTVNVNCLDLEECAHLTGEVFPVSCRKAHLLPFRNCICSNSGL